MELWEQIAADITDKNSVKFSSAFEANIAAVLDLMDIEFSCKSLQFSLNTNGKKITYTPDFVLAEKHWDKTVLIETHGKRYIDRRFIEKMNLFKHSPESLKYYLIIITDKEPKRPNKLKIELKKCGYEEKDICNDIWYIPYNTVLGRQLQVKNEEGSIYCRLKNLKREEQTESSALLLRKERNALGAKRFGASKTTA